MVWSGPAHGITLDVVAHLSDVTFGVPDADIQGVVEAAARFWESNLPRHPGFVRRLAGDVTFKVTFVEDADPGLLPAGTDPVPANTARPTDGMPLTIHVQARPGGTEKMYWDRTPTLQEADEFTEVSPGTGIFQAVGGGRADGQWDMFTVFLHELGHVIAYNDYQEFDRFVRHVWNDGAGGRTDIDRASDHFVSGHNLMSEFAGLPDLGMSGRVLARPEDYLPVSQAPAALVLGLGAAFALRRRGRPG